MSNVFILFPEYFGKYYSLEQIQGHFQKICMDMENNIERSLEKEAAIRALNRSSEMIRINALVLQQKRKHHLHQFLMEQN